MNTPMEEDGVHSSEGAQGAGLAQPPGKEKGGPATVFNHMESDPEEMEPDLSQKWSAKD